jgi:hypothetical protein
MKKIFIVWFLISMKCSYGQYLLMNSIFSNPSTSTALFSVSDNFNSYTNGNLAGQGNWVFCLNEIDILNGEVYSNTPTANYEESCVMRSETFTSNQYSQISATSIVDHGYIGAAIRCSSGGNFYGYYTTDDKRIFYKSINGVYTGIANVTGLSQTGPITLRIEVVGSTIRCLLNGALDTELTGGTGIFIDTDLTNGTPGINGEQNYQTMADNWSGGNL